MPRPTLCPVRGAITATRCTAAQNWLTGAPTWPQRWFVSPRQSRRSVRRRSRTESRSVTIAGHDRRARSAAMDGLPVVDFFVQ